MAVTTALVATAAASAYSANQQAKAQNKAVKAANQPKTSTSTSNPYMDQALQPHLDKILGAQGGYFDSTFGGAPAPAAAPPKKMTKREREAAALIPKNPKNRVAAATAGSVPGGPVPAQKPAGAKDILRDVASAGLNAGNSELVKSGGEFVQGQLGAKDFSGQNAILQDLYGKVGGETGASFQQPMDMLSQFLQGNNSGGGSGAVASRPSGGMGGQHVRYKASSNSSNASGGGVSGGSGVQDATGYGLFGDEIRKIFDPAHLDPANDPTMQPLIDSMKTEALEAHYRSLQDLDAKMEGAGRYGGGLYQAARTGANEEFDESLQGEMAKLFAGQRQGAQDRVMQALGLVNNRDLAAMNDRTQRQGIAASSGSAQAGLDMQRELAMRGQDLEAINSMMKHQQFGLSTQAGLGQQLSTNQLAALGSIPGLEGIGLSGLQSALGAGTSMANLDASMAQTNAQRSIANKQLGFAQQQYQDQLPQQRINDYLRTVAAIGGMGGTQTSTNPGANMPMVNTTSAAIMGGLGGLSMAGGMAGMYGAGGGAPAAAASQPTQSPYAAMQGWY